MQSSNIAQTKNQLSRLLERVKLGESILITDRNRPVARLEPLVNTESALASLQASGLLNPPRSTLDLPKFLNAERPQNPAASLTAAILSEREESR